MEIPHSGLCDRFSVPSPWFPDRDQIRSIDEFLDKVMLRVYQMHTLQEFFHGQTG